MIDQTQPSAGFVTPTSGQTVTLGQSLVVNISAGDALSGIDASTCRITNMNGVVTTGTYTGSASSGHCTGTITIPTGNYVGNNKPIQLTIKDSAGNRRDVVQYVTVQEGQTTPSVAGISPSTNIQVNQLTTFYINENPGTQPTTAYWISWGDSSWYYRYAVGATITHTYSSIQSYPLTAIAENAVGNGTTASFTMQVITIPTSGESAWLEDSSGYSYQTPASIEYPIKSKIRLSIPNGDSYTCLSYWACNNTGGTCTPEMATGSNLIVFNQYYDPSLDSSFDFSSRAIYYSPMITCTSPTRSDVNYVPSIAFYTPARATVTVLFEEDSVSGFITSISDTGHRIRPVLNYTRNSDSSSIGTLTNAYGGHQCQVQFNGQTLYVDYDPGTNLYTGAAYTTLGYVAGFTANALC
jgi:hypothetical protein